MSNGPPKHRALLAAAAAAVMVGACSQAPGSAIPSRQPTGTTRLVVVGDFGIGNDNERSVASAIRALPGGFGALVTTGDNVYPDGSPERFAGAWTEPYGWVQDAGIPVLAALGNHDRETDGGAQVADELGMPADWYVRRVGPVDVIVLDAGRTGDTDQTAFLRDALRGSSAPWQVVAFHEPVYSCSHHGSTPEVQDAWLTTLQAEGADLVLNGHDHTYERFAPPGGPVYVVTGGGGAPLYPMGECRGGTPQPIAAESVFNFVTIDATPSSLEVTAVQVPDGTAIDRFTIPA